MNPGDGLWSATHRGDLPGEPLTIDEAIAAFTAGAAYAVHEEDRLGVIERGRIADLTLWMVEDERWTPTATRCRIAWN